MVLDYKLNYKIELRIWKMRNYKNNNKMKFFKNVNKNLFKMTMI